MTKGKTMLRKILASLALTALLLSCAPAPARAAQADCRHTGY